MIIVINQRITAELILLMVSSNKLSKFSSVFSLGKIKKKFKNTCYSSPVPFLFWLCWLHLSTCHKWPVLFPPCFCFPLTTGCSVSEFLQRFSRLCWSQTPHVQTLPVLLLPTVTASRSSILKWKFGIYAKALVYIVDLVYTVLNFFIYFTF